MHIQGFYLYPVLLLAFVNVSIDAEILFRYSHQTGDKWHITSRIHEDVLYDGALFNQVEILNKISVEILKSHENDGLLYNHYHIAEQPVGGDFFRWSEDYDVTYARDSRGRISGLKNDSLIPLVRNVPVFPEESVEIFDTWEARGQEVFDLKNTFGIDEILVIDFLAVYTYEGSERIDGRDTEKILIEFSYNWKPEIVRLRRMQVYDVYPVGITGKFEQIIFWDQAVGRNFAENGHFSYTYSMNDGHTYTFRGTTEGQAVYAEPLDKEQIVNEMEGLDDVDAIVTEEGVAITLDSIHFVPDSAEILPGEETLLALVADILRKIPDRDILVIGHTASISPYEDGQKLSEERAGTVARYFVDTGTRKSTQIIIRGMGDSQPIAYNDTEEGRKKNRRVEIIILEN